MNVTVFKRLLTTLPARLIVARLALERTMEEVGIKPFEALQARSLYITHSYLCRFVVLPFFHLSITP